ncbi:hypothetical protein, partial [Streptomyces venezuelae]|uniref:hypothetical protein n=1 Tax=Streptomyces venezuelae TaxID=54571 RepID=UPI00278BDB5B
MDRIPAPWRPGGTNCAIAQTSPASPRPAALGRPGAARRGGAPAGAGVAAGRRAAAGAGARDHGVSQD